MDIGGITAGLIQIRSPSLLNLHTFERRMRLPQQRFVCHLKRTIDNAICKVP